MISAANNINFVGPINDLHPLSRGLVGFWLPGIGFDGGSTLYDLTRFRHNGTLMGNTTWRGRPYPGGFSSLVLDGTGDHVETSLTTKFPTSAGTMSIFFNPSNVYNSGVREFVWGSWYQPAGQSFEIGIQHFTNDVLYCGWKNGATDTRVQVTASATNWIQNEWQQYTLTWVSGQSTVVYHNGVQIGSGASASTFTLDPTAHVDFGTTTDQVYELTGAISTTLLYDRAMSAVEVQRHYRECLDGFPGLLNRIRHRLQLPAQIVSVGTATESDTAQAIAAAKKITLGLATETDTAQSIGSQKTLSVGVASETDTSQPIASAKSVTLGVATEADTAQPITSAKVRTVGVASETDSAQGITPDQPNTPVGLATETDTAQSIGSQKTLSVGVVSESDSAQAINPQRLKLVGLASEVAAAQSISWSKRREVGVATETDAAQAITLVRVVVDIRRRRGILDVADQRRRSVVQSDEIRRRSVPGSDDRRRRSDDRVN